MLKYALEKGSKEIYQNANSVCIRLVGFEGAFFHFSSFQIFYDVVILHYNGKIIFKIVRACPSMHMNSRTGSHCICRKL